MDLWNADKLLLFIVFVIPGFLLLKANAVLGLEPPADSSKQIVDAVAYSCINYALLAWPILLVEGSSLRKYNEALYFGFYGAVVFAFPVLLALAWRLLRSTQLLQEMLPHPTAKPWDFVFRKRRPYWILVTFKDGKQVAGRYDSDSFASASPTAEQIFLQEAWALSEEGGFERPRTNSAGILVLGSEVRTLEFFNFLQEERNGNETSTTKRTAGEGMAAQADTSDPDGPP